MKRYTLKNHSFLMIAALAAPLITACNKSSEPTAPSYAAPTSDLKSATPEPTPAPTAAPAPAAAPEVPASAPAAAAAVIQTQPGPNGVQVDLQKVSVAGNVMTVQLDFRNASKDYQTLRIEPEDVSVIDDSTSQRYSLLKDEAGKVMASPLDSGKINAGGSAGGNTVVWVKFPAPPATTKTVSINLPQVGSFDGVPVTR